MLNFNRVKIFRVLFIIFFTICSCSSIVYALNQLINSKLSINTSNWTVDNAINHSVLTVFAHDASDGNPLGSFYANTPESPLSGSIPKRFQDGIIQQSFNTPANPVNVRLRMDYKNTWTKKPDLLGVYGTLRLDGSGIYPNEAVVSTFLSEETFNTFPSNNSWTSIPALTVGLDANSTYIFRVYWNHECRKKEAAGTYVDNLVCNMSPSGLIATASGSSVVLGWTDSGGAATLASYNVYRSATSGGPYTLLGNTGAISFEDASPLALPVAYYAISDVDTDGIESPYSPEFEFVAGYYEPDLASGTVFQKIATSTFSNLAPDNRYILSAWVCPGSGTAKVGFIQTKPDGSIYSSVDLQIASSGKNLINTSNSVVISSGVSKKVDFDKVSDFTYFRVYLIFDLVFDESLASDTMIFLQNDNPATDNPHDVWFDGIQLEQAIRPEVDRPSSFCPNKKIVSPNIERTIDGKDSYYEW